MSNDGEFTDFLSNDGAETTAEKALKVTNIINSARFKVDQMTEKKEKKGRIMVGKTNYNLPTDDKLRSTAVRRHKEKT